MNKERLIADVHAAITKSKGKEYAPTVTEIQEWINMNMDSTETYNRKAIFANLKTYDFTSKEHDYIEICEWYNGDGFDVELNSNPGARFQMTWGQYDALVSLVDKLKGDDN